jgi:hypothetical protein
MRSRGAGTIEFVVIFLLFAGLFLGLFEMTRIYRAKHVLNTATFAAARSGSLHHARLDAMNAELANGMTPVLMGSGRSVESLALARQRAAALLARPGIGVQIVSPTRQTYEHFQRAQWTRFEDQAADAWQRGMPNDNLRQRPRETWSAADGSGPSQINLQDANLLKIRSVWCHRLATPVLDRVIFDIATASPFITERQSACMLLSSIPGQDVPGFYVAISADAIVRMQSTISSADLPAS